MAGPPNNENARDIEETRLLQEVADARQDYESVKKIAQTLTRTSADVGYANPDGTEAIKQAMRLERAAMRRYTAASVRFSKFILEREQK